MALSPPPFTPGSTAIPATSVELSVSCRNLIDSDVFSKSDPMCVLFIMHPGGHEWREFGRTEIVWNQLNPEFVKKFVIQYYFEESQKLKFELFDVDSKNPSLSAHDFLGRMECTLAEIVTENKLHRKLQGQRKECGTIKVAAEELSSCKENVFLQLRGHKLDKKDLFGKSDPFLIFYRCNEDGSFTAVHRTEVIKKNLNPTWRPFYVLSRALCNGDLDRTLKVECYDWDADGGHDYIGEFMTNLRQLTRGSCSDNVFELINSKKQKKSSKYKNSGTIELMQCKIEKVHSFLDFVRGGTQIHCTFAVDFTASNGQPNNPSSLHFLSPYQLSPYANAILSVGNIIQDYDSDKKFPALGFGARLPPDGVVSHDFVLNGNPTNPFCDGITGVLDSYYSMLRQVQLYGPTNFAPCINHVARFATARQHGTDYFILVIITDGIITDMPQTCEAIVNAATLPMSIIIIGVGDAEFEAMEVLDGDDVRVSSKGRYAARDIVQFVPMRDFVGRSAENPAAVQARLAKEVLQEVPDQLLSYMKSRGVNPRPPLQRQDTGLSLASNAPVL